MNKHDSFNYTWYKAKLLPAAYSIFTNSFYPNEEEIPGEVYCAIVPITERNVRVIIASRMAENSFRGMTVHMASRCIDIIHPVSSNEANKLNSLAMAFAGKFNQV